MSIVGNEQAGTRRPGGRFTGPGAVATVALAGLLLLGAYVWSENAPSRALARMDPLARKVEYDRVLAELRSLCAPPEPALEEHCRHQARFLVRFPECDAACEKAVRAAQPVQATR